MKDSRNVVRAVNIVLQLTHECMTILLCDLL